jgi:hypothetical protein
VSTDVSCLPVTGVGNVRIGYTQYVVHLTGVAGATVQPYLSESASRAEAVTLDDAGTGTVTFTGEFTIIREIDEPVTFAYTLDGERGEALSMTLTTLPGRTGQACGVLNEDVADAPADAPTPASEVPPVDEAPVVEDVAVRPEQPAVVEEQAPAEEPAPAPTPAPAEEVPAPAETDARVDAAVTPELVVVTDEEPTDAE